MMMMMMIIETLPCHTTTAIGLDHDDKDVGDKDDGTGCDDDEDDDVDVDDDNPNYLLDQPQQLRVLLCLKKAVRTKSIIINTNFSFCPAPLRKGWCYQIGRIFGKVLKGGGIIFNPKIYIADYGPL